MRVLQSKFPKTNPNDFQNRGAHAQRAGPESTFDMTWERACLADANQIHEKSKFPHQNLIFLQVIVLSDYHVFVQLCYFVLSDNRVFVPSCHLLARLSYFIDFKCY